MIWAYTLVSVGLVSAIPLTGLLLLRQRTERVRRVALWLVSFAIGALLGGAVLHLIPEAFERLGSGPGLSLYLLAGFLGFFVLEKFLCSTTLGQIGLVLLGIGLMALPKLLE
jgi:zinc and cadmium transporter